MQLTTNTFNTRAASNMRPISGSVFISFEKNFNSATDFFTLDISSLDGGDILQGEGDVIQEWNKYDYVDYSSRLISLEWTRQEDPVSSVTLAIADIELDNHDGYFTPNGSSPIADFILPYRPIQLYAGFKGENLPVFIGLTEKMPEINEKSKTIKFHCIDFLQSILNRPLEESVLYQDFRTDEIISDLLILVGLLPSQFVLDVGLNIIPFAYFPKKTKLGDALRELMEAEQGRLFMDEIGMIRFKSRQNYPSNPVYAFDGSNVLQNDIRKQDDLINVVEVTAKPRAVQELQKYWESSGAVLIPAGGSKDIWAQFNDPVTSLVAPLDISVAVSSSYTTNQLEDGSGSSLSGIIALDSASLFATSYKMTFENAGSVDGYITNVTLYATPAKLINEDGIYVREQDDVSVGKYDEHVYPIENDFIQSAVDARSRALVLLADYSEYGSPKELLVKGNPALQISDMLSISLPGGGEFIITKIVGKLMNFSLRQILTVKQFDRHNYFILDSSSLDNGFELAP